MKFLFYARLGEGLPLVVAPQGVNNQPDINPGVTLMQHDGSSGGAHRQFEHKIQGEHSDPVVHNDGMVPFINVQNWVQCYTD